MKVASRKAGGRHRRQQDGLRAPAVIVVIQALRGAFTAVRLWFVLREHEAPATHWVADAIANLQELFRS